ncbi:MAG: Semialdehyde dehydrogenase, dimerization region, partial [Bryobacterales bacterium]|nr:Semialdehyde dehydrogenase, dimerization region [Bryobacterales bacterium]
MADIIALVGGDTLLGREIREVFNESSLGRSLKLVAGEEDESGKVVAIDGGVSFLTDLREDEIEDAGIVILAGSAESSRRALAVRPNGLVIDLTAVAEDEPEARLRAPLVEDVRLDPDRGDQSDLNGPVIVAHPAAVAIAILLRRLHRTFGVSSAVIQIFEPASERGKAGVDELQQQTVSLLSFQDVPKKLFDAQLTFNMLAQLGEQAELPLIQTEERIERHLATLLDSDDGVPLPSIRLIQAPVFHGYSMSVWVTFDDAPSPREIEEDLTEAGIDVRAEGL